MAQTLNDLMQIDHVVRVREGGAIDDDVIGVWAPEFSVSTDEDGQILADHERDMIADVERQGWTLLRGWTRQYMAGNTPTMHESEYIGGALEEHIRETPGLYCAVAVETGPDDNAPGWAVAYRES